MLQCAPKVTITGVTCRLRMSRGYGWVAATAVCTLVGSGGGVSVTRRTTTAEPRRADQHPLFLNVDVVLHPLLALEWDPDSVASHTGTTGTTGPTGPAGHTSPTAAVNWEQVRLDITTVLEASPDNSLAATVLRLAWHASGTYDGSELPVGGVVHGGATMRFEPEAGYDDNRGLQVAREALAEVIGRHPGASHADVWVLGGYLAVEHLGGPRIPFRHGRTDAPSGGPLCPSEARLPAFNASAESLRESFGRLGFTDRGLVALIGAHTVGHTHSERSGFPYMQWDGTPKKFDNQFFDFLLEDWWIFDDEDKERPYYRNRSWIMLLSDWVLREDAAFRPLVEEYANDEQVWHDEFAVAFKKLTELGWTLADGDALIKAQALDQTQRVGKL